MKRKVADDLNQRRIVEVAAMWGNANMDMVEDDPNIRSNMQRELEINYNTAIAALYGEKIEANKEDEIDYNNPFWAAMKRGIEKYSLPKEVTAEDIEE